MIILMFISVQIKDTENARYFHILFEWVSVVILRALDIFIIII